ncbi:hypothetical protein PG995_002010 [Apiospora arundinis]
MTKIDFPRAGAERAVLKQAVRRHAFSPEYAKLQELNKALSSGAERPATPPSYVPPGWTIEQARRLDPMLVEKLPENEQWLWAAGHCADVARRARKTGRQDENPPAHIPAGWSVEQARSPTFDILSRLPGQELRRYIESRNEQNLSRMPPPVALEAGSGRSTHQPPSPLMQTLQGKGYPAWGFVVVRSYYGSDERWQAFQEKLGIMCDAQIDQETGEGLQKAKDMLEFKIIEDPSLQGVSHSESREQFHIARAMDGVAAGLDLDILLVVNDNVVDSFLGDGTESSTESLSPYLVAVDVTEPTSYETPGGYPGFFKVSMEALLSELYPKFCLGLSAMDLWATLGDEQTLWIGDDE